MLFSILGYDENFNRLGARLENDFESYIIPSPILFLGVPAYHKVVKPPYPHTSATTVFSRACNQETMAELYKTRIKKNLVSLKLFYQVMPNTGLYLSYLSWYIGDTLG